MQGLHSKLMSSIIAAKFMCILTSLRCRMKRLQYSAKATVRPLITAAIRLLIERARMPAEVELLVSVINAAEGSTAYETELNTDSK